MSNTETTAQQTRVLVADDHALVREGIRKILSLDPDLEVVGEAATPAALMALLATRPVDVLTLDLVMPECQGVDLIRKVKAALPDLPILVLTMHADPHIARQVLDQGVRGYLTKDSSPELLLDAIHKVRQGQSYIDPTLAPLLIRELNPPAGPLASLSAREREVLLALVRGRSISEIASDLKLAGNTVSTYKLRLMEKLGQPTIAELTRFAIRHGLVD